LRYAVPKAAAAGWLFNRYPEQLLNSEPLRGWGRRFRLGMVAVSSKEKSEKILSKISKATLIRDAIAIIHIS